MSGGGNPLKGRMGTKVQADDQCTPEMIKSMQENLVRNEQSLKDYCRRKQELEPL